MTHTHARWIRISHWIVTLSVLTLAFTGFVILMAHPRLYWGDAGNDLTPALIELPISRNYKHGGYETPTPFFDAAAAPVTANRTYDILNKNGWGRSLHFLAAWWLVLPGAIYLAIGVGGGHFRSNISPAGNARTGGPQYSFPQRCVYSFVIFVATPLVVATGLAMSPALAAAFPILRVFGGFQSARTIHFFTFAALLLFVSVHVVMVIRTGFRRQIRAMTLGGTR